MSMLHLSEGPLHGSCVSYKDKGVLILGKPGAGKSELALSLMGFGAVLVSDDHVLLTRDGDLALAQSLPSTPDLIEVRKVGLLKAVRKASAVLSLIVDLDHAEQDRLPPSRKGDVAGVVLDLINGKSLPNLVFIVLQTLKCGRYDPDHVF